MLVGGLALDEAGARRNHLNKLGDKGLNPASLVFFKDLFLDHDLLSQDLKPRFTLAMFDVTMGVAFGLRDPADSKLQLELLKLAAKLLKTRVSDLLP